MTALDESILRHDRVHEPADDPRWRESYYFSFFDERTGIGGFSSIGKRPARGHSGSINAIWGPATSTLIASELGSFEGHDDAYDVAGLSYASDEPYGSWRLRFEGVLNDGGSEIECDHGALGPTGRSLATKVEVAYDLTFTPSYPPYLYEHRPEWRDLFTGHVDEVGAVTGEVEIAGQRYEIDARGGKDHSWGVRDWFKAQAWRWIDLVGGELAAECALWRATFDGDEWVEDGAIFTDGSALALERYREEFATVPRAGKERPAEVSFAVDAGGRTLEAEGRVVRVVPIFFGRDVDGGRLVSWNDRALVECTVDGRPGWANVEFESLVRE
jgi:hypothetical protein